MLSALRRQFLGGDSGRQFGVHARPRIEHFRGDFGVKLNADVRPGGERGWSGMVVRETGRTVWKD